MAPCRIDAPSAHRPIAADEPLAEARGAFEAAPQALTSWAMAAGPGRACIYARVVRLSRMGVASRARELVQMGLIDMLPQRRVADDLFEYRVRRTTRPFADALPIRDESGMSSDERLLLELLVTLADSGDRCPGNVALAAMLGLKRATRVGELMKKLRQRRLIGTSFVGNGPDPLRVIEIIETGARTAE